MKTPPIGLVHEATIRIDETLIVPRLPAAIYRDMAASASAMKSMRISS